MFKAASRFTRAYHAVSHPNTIVNLKTPENRLLSKAIENVPLLGFSGQCITQAARDSGYLDSVHSLFTSKDQLPEFQLVLFWLKLQRQKLYDHVLDPKLEFHSVRNEYDRAAYLINKRLEYNAPIVGKLTGALSQLVLPYNIGLSLEELHNLSDDVAFYAGDMSNDLAWYAKRALFSTVYVKSELYMLQDLSENFKQTKEFVNGCVRNVQTVGNSYNAVEEWGMFNAISLVNLIRSQLARG